MLSTIIHYEVIMNIALTILVVCLATYTIAQDMRLKKYKMQLADMQAAHQWGTCKNSHTFSHKKQRLAA